MNGVSLEFANITTPVPLSSSDWLNYSENKKEIIQNFPEVKDNYLKTKKIL